MCGMPRRRRQTPLLAALADAREQITVMTPGQAMTVPLLVTCRTELARRLGVVCASLFGRGCYSVTMQDGGTALVRRLDGSEGYFRVREGSDAS